VLKNIVDIVQLYYPHRQDNKGHVNGFSDKFILVHPIQYNLYRLDGEMKPEYYNRFHMNFLIFFYGKVHNSKKTQSKKN